MLNKDRFKTRVWDVPNKSFTDNYSINNPDHVMQQCTGLKDKNGSLIFEGDLFKFQDDSEETLEVKYCECCGSLAVASFFETDFYEKGECLSCDNECFVGGLTLSSKKDRLGHIFMPKDNED